MPRARLTFRNVRPPDPEWQTRGARAETLARSRPASAEALRFYASLVHIQSTLSRDFPDGVFTDPARAFIERLNVDVVVRARPVFARDLIPHAPHALARDLAAAGESDHWRDWLTEYWSTGGRAADSWPAARAFLTEALLQPFASVAAACASSATESTENDSNHARQCPLCTGRPIAAALREEAHGARRSLVCGFCQSEWRAPRIQCIQCGELEFGSLPVFRTDEFTAARIDACDSCYAYIKTIDLTRDGNAIAIVDDLATLPLDLWASEQGYRRIRPNLLRI